MAFTTDFSGGDYEDRLQAYSTTALRQAEDVANRPFQQYTGERVAGFDPLEVEGREAALALARQGVGMPEVQQAADVASRAAGYQAGTYDPALMAGSDLSQYMSPYMEQAIDPALRQLREQQAMTMQGVSDAAARAGAFGGSRQGVLEAETLKGFGQQQADIINQAQQRAYEQAVAQRTGDIERLNEAQRTNEAMRLGGLQAQLSGATALSQVANQLRGLGYTDAEIMRSMGQEGRALEQARLEVPYQEFMREQAFPTQQLSARLAPLGYGASVAQAAPTVDEPSFLQQTLGGVGYLANIAGGLGKAGIIGGAGSGSLFEF